jgi:hypothetical protein
MWYHISIFINSHTHTIVITDHYTEDKKMEEIYHRTRGTACRCKITWIALWCSCEERRVASCIEQHAVSSDKKWAQIFSCINKPQLCTDSYYINKDYRTTGIKLGRQNDFYYILLENIENRFVLVVEIFIRFLTCDLKSWLSLLFLESY